MTLLSAVDEADATFGADPDRETILEPIAVVHVEAVSKRFEERTMGVSVDHSGEVPARDPIACRFAVLRDVRWRPGMQRSRGVADGARQREGDVGGQQIPDPLGGAGTQDASDESIETVGSGHPVAVEEEPAMPPDVHAESVWIDGRAEEIRQESSDGEIVVAGDEADPDSGVGRFAQSEEDLHVEPGDRRAPFPPEFEDIPPEHQRVDTSGQPLEHAPQILDTGVVLRSGSEVEIGQEKAFSGLLRPRKKWWDPGGCPEGRIVHGAKG